MVVYRKDLGGEVLIEIFKVRTAKMNTNSVIDRLKKWLSKEVVVHFLLWLLYFIVIAYQKNRISIRFGGPSHLQLVDFVFALNYFLVIIIINYRLLTRYFYRKRYAIFLMLSLLLMLGAVLIEEFVMERVFFPGSNRAKNFSGFLPTVLEIGPTIIFFVGFKLAWDNLKKQTALEQVEKEKTESQLQFLKSQLNPHFLFNNLNNLYSYAQENSPKTPEIILQLSAIMRYMLYESKENLVPLEKELKYLEDFIRLQELQMEDRGQVEYTTKGDVHLKRIAPLILIAFVENSFKHSLSSLAEDIWINVKAEVKGEELWFECANTFAQTANSSEEYLSKGIGLQNVQKRLELQYPGKHQLDIRIEDNTYLVNLKLDLQTNGV